MQKKRIKRQKIVDAVAAARKKMEEEERNGGEVREGETKEVNSSNGSVSSSPSSGLSESEILTLVEAAGNKITKTFESGNVYVCQMKGGSRNGYGTCSFANGDKYVGQYKNNECHGNGIYTLANGIKYVGEFKNNKRPYAIVRFQSEASASAALSHFAKIPTQKDGLTKLPSSSSSLLSVSFLDIDHQVDHQTQKDIDNNDIDNDTNNHNECASILDPKDFMSKGCQSKITVVKPTSNEIIQSHCNLKMH